MKSDSYGNILLNESDLFELLYTKDQIDFPTLLIDNHIEVERFNQAVHKNADRIVKLQQYSSSTLDQKTYDQSNQNNWHMPEEYQKMDIEGYLVNVCPKQNYDRLITELQEFRSRNMINLLRWLKYFVDTCRKESIVWGVGRGSSVASYTLFLLGVHKIDSIKYKLDIKEFFK